MINFLYSCMKECDYKIKLNNLKLYISIRNLHRSRNLPARNSGTTLRQNISFHNSYIVPIDGMNMNLIFDYALCIKYILNHKK